MNKRQTMISNLILLLVAIIWGFAFVAQRVGAEYIGPYTFNGIRFALGSISLLPLMIFMSRKHNTKDAGKGQMKKVFQAGIAAGCLLFIGSSLQQVGLIYTSAGKAAFITGVYIILVPILGIFFRQYIAISTWIGAIVALIGLYLLCVTEAFTVSNGDWLELAGSLFWAFHILVIGYYSKKVDVIKLSCIQFAVCSVLSLIIAVLFEKISLTIILQASWAILYGGIFSVGIAYTLQVVGQKNAKPAHAAIILSMESLFAAIGGAVFLKEILQTREVLGCIIMLIGIVLSQLQLFGKQDSFERQRSPSADERRSLG